MMISHIFFFSKSHYFSQLLNLGNDLLYTVTKIYLLFLQKYDLMRLNYHAQYSGYCGKFMNHVLLQDELEGTPPASQLSRSDSGSSYQSPTSSQQSSGGGTGINAVRFTLRRTVSLDKKGFQS